MENLNQLFGQPSTLQMPFSGLNDMGPKERNYEGWAAPNIWKPMVRVQMVVLLPHVFMFISYKSS